MLILKLVLCAYDFIARITLFVFILDAMKSASTKIELWGKCWFIIISKCSFCKFLKYTFLAFMLSHLRVKYDTLRADKRKKRFECSVLLKQKWEEKAVISKICLSFQAQANKKNMLALCFTKNRVQGGAHSQPTVNALNTNPEGTPHTLSTHRAITVTYSQSPTSVNFLATVKHRYWTGSTGDSNKTPPPQFYFH